MPIAHKTPPPTIIPLASATQKTGRASLREKELNASGARIEWLFEMADAYPKPVLAEREECLPVADD